MVLSTDVVKNGIHLAVCSSLTVHNCSLSISSLIYGQHYSKALRNWCFFAVKHYFNVTGAYIATKIVHLTARAEGVLLQEDHGCLSIDGLALRRKLVVPTRLRP